ncbi:hypothetical protein OROHE_015441 [Orobanche hederae]
MAVNSNEECLSVHGVVVLPDGGVANTQYELPAKLSSLEVPKFMKSQTCLNSEPSLQSHTKLEVDTVNSHAPCILDVDIEKGKAESIKFNEDCVANSKSGGSLAITLPREICLQIGGKLMQLLMNHGTDLPKFTSRERFVAERVHDMPNNRSRKFKRSASFNSRRVVLLFSVLGLAWEQLF